MSKNRKKIWFKVISLSITFIFSVSSVSTNSNIAEALSAWSNMDSIALQRDALQKRLEETGRIEYAESKEQISRLKDNNRGILLESNGKVLAPKRMKEDNKQLIRSIIFHEVKTLLIMLARDNHKKYQKIQKHILSLKRSKQAYLTMSKNSFESDNEFFNEMIARAFEILIPLEKGFLSREDFTPEEVRFAAELSRNINKYKSMFFTDVFWDWDKRSIAVRVALTRSVNSKTSVNSSEEIKQTQKISGSAQEEMTPRERYFRDLLQSANKLSPQLIVYELMRKLFEAPDQQLLLVANPYLGILSDIFMEQPDLIMPDIVEKLSEGLEHTNTSIQMASSKLLAVVCLKKPEMVPDEIVDTLIAKDQAKDENFMFGLMRRTSDILGLISLSNHRKADDVTSYLEEKITVKSKGAWRLNFEDPLACCALYKKRPDLVDEERLSYLMELLSNSMERKGNIEAIKTVYIEKEEYRDKIIDKVFDGILASKDDEHDFLYRNYGRNAGYLLASIAEIDPEAQNEIGSQIESILIDRYTESPLEDKIAILEAVSGSLELSNILCSEKIFHETYHILLKKDYSHNDLTNLLDLFVKFVKTHKDFLTKTHLDIILDVLERHKEIRGQEELSNIIYLGNMFSAIAEVRDDLVNEEMVTRLEGFLDIENPDKSSNLHSFANILTYLKAATCQAFYGVLQTRPELVPNSVGGKIYKLFLENDDYFISDFVKPLAGIVKKGDRATADLIVSSIKEKLDGYYLRGNVVSVLGEIFEYDKSYVDDQTVRKILAGIESERTERGYESEKVLTLITNKFPHTYGKKILADMLRRVNMSQDSISDHVVSFLGGIAKNSDVEEIEECRSFLRDKKAGFGLSEEDMFAGLAFLFAFSESADTYFLYRILDMIQTTYSYKDISELLGLSYAYYYTGQFDKFIHFLEEIEKDSFEVIVAVLRDNLADIYGGTDESFQGITDLELWEDEIDTRPETETDQDTQETGVSGWREVRSFLRMAIENPVVAETLIAKIIITMHYLRLGIGGERFEDDTQIESTFPELQRLLIELLSVREISVLSKRNLTKVLALGSADLIDRLRREAIAMSIACYGRDRRSGLAGRIRDDIHNAPSPQQLNLVIFYRNWLLSECRSAEEAANLSRMGYSPNSEDVISNDNTRQRVIEACDALIITLDEVYGEACMHNLGEIYQTWAEALPDMEDVKTLIGSVLNESTDQRGTDEYLDRVVAAREALLGVINNISGEQLLKSYQLLNGLEIVFYGTFNALEKDYSNLSKSLEKLKELLSNTVHNGYRTNSITNICNELDNIDLTNEEEACRRLYSIIKRIERIISYNASFMVRNYQNLAERTARRMGVPAEDQVWVENFSANLFRSDTIFLLSLALRDIKKIVMERTGISGWQVIVRGRMKGRLVYAKNSNGEGMFKGNDIVTGESVYTLTKNDILVIEEISAAAPPVTSAGGIIALKEDGLLSHAAIRARQHEIPYIICPDRETMLSLLEKYEDKEIEINAETEQVRIEEPITPEETIARKKIEQDIETVTLVDVPMVERKGDIVVMPEDYELATVGNKAFRLGRIRRGDELSKHVTLGFEFYEQVLNMEQNNESRKKIRTLIDNLASIKEDYRIGLLRDIRRQIRGLAISPEMLQEISRIIIEHIGDGLVFVRSSTNAEDLYGYAGAGLYESYGTIDPANLNALEDYIKRVWMSMWGERAYYDREANGIVHKNVKMSVLVHEMLLPEYSFVVHTQNPSNGKSEEIIIEIVQGLGETLVGDDYEGSPHRFSVNRRTGEITRLSYANKDIKLIFENGVIREKSVDYTEDIFTLNKPEAIAILKRIAIAAVETEEDFEKAQDIEGCIVLSDDKRKFIFVQTRDQQGSEKEKAPKLNLGTTVQYDTETEYVKKSFDTFDGLRDDVIDELKKEYAGYAREASAAATAREDTGQSLILFADDLLDNAVIMDIENTIKSIVKRKNVFQDGKIVLFAKEEEKAVILENVIKNTGLEAEIIIISEENLVKFRNIQEEKDLIKTLVRVARARGARDILGVIKGPTEEPEKLADISRELKIPVIMVGLEKAVYSFAQALSLAMKIKTSNGTSGWLVILPPVRTINEELQKQYEKYQASLQALIAA